MSRKFYFSFLVAVAVFMAGHMVSYAQTVPTGGVVKVRKADGTEEVVPNALVEVYRVDMQMTSPAAKTDKRGEFRFAGLALGGTFVLAVSAPNCAPMALPNVRAGQEDLWVVLVPGDGRKLTEAEARRAKLTNAVVEGPRELTDDEKKAKEKYDKETAEIEAKNAKAAKTNEVITKVAQDGKAAMDAKNYDLAISKYEEGITAAPDFLGSAPLFNNNRSIALRIRAVENRNNAIKLTDAAAKLAGLESTKKDLAASAAGYLRSWTILSGAAATEIVDRSNYETNKIAALAGAHETFRMAVLTEQVDPSVIEAAKILIPEYVANEPDAAKKAAAKVMFADLYRIVQDRENAIAAYRKVLETNPDNLDAMAYLGLVLVDLSWLKDNDKALSQEGANYLQKFVSAAPDTNKLKIGAVEYLSILKTQNVAPQKLPATTKKKP